MSSRRLSSRAVLNWLSDAVAVDIVSVFAIINNSQVSPRQPPRLQQRLSPKTKITRSKSGNRNAGIPNGGRTRQSRRDSFGGSSLSLQPGVLIVALVAASYVCVSAASHGRVNTTDEWQSQVARRPPARQRR